MFDKRIRRTIDPAINHLAAILVRAGINPTQVTVAGFVIGMTAALAIGCEQFGLGLGLILLSRLADGLDGAVARIGNTVSDQGAFLDIVFDFIFYSAIPFAFAFANPTDNALPAAFLIWSFVGTGASFLAFAIMVQKQDLSAKTQTSKSFHYLGGLTEGSETILFLCLVCILPQYFGLMAWGFATLAWVTTAARLYQGWTTLQNEQ